MRVLIIDTYYPAFLASHYRERPDLSEASYAIQWRALMDRSFGTSDAYSHFLGALGHEAQEIVVNCEPLQRTWVSEHAVRLDKKTRSGRNAAIVVAQVEQYRPDVIYFQDVGVLPLDVLVELRKHSAFLVGQIASQTPRHSQLEAFDLLVTAAPHFVDPFRRAGLDTEFIRLAFDPRVLDRLGTAPPLRDRAAFVGALGRSRTWRSNAVVERAADSVKIEFWGYKASRLPLRRAVQRRYHGQAWGLDMYRVLASSRIAINRHGDIAENHAINMRLYEATGVGALLVTDAMGDLADVFSPGNEVVTYADASELVEKVRYYLEHEEERAAIARAGRERTLRDHTYAKRMHTLARALERRLR